MPKRIRIVVLLVVIATAGYFGFSYYQHKNDSNTGVIQVSGNMEATEVRLAFRVSGKIQALLTDEGMKLSVGQTAAKLETDELTKIKNEAEAGLNAALAAAVKADDDYRRIDNLFTSGAVTDQQRVSAKTGADAARANVEAMKATLELAKTRLGFAQLISPIEGFVLTKSAEAGEVVAAGATIFTVADLHTIWLTAYVNEPDLGKVKLNQLVEIKTDTYPDKSYQGKISFISQQAEFTPKQIQTAEERVKLVYRIKVTVENTELELKPGMPADGFIQLGDPNDTV